jgi:hypothetical protein
MNKIRLRQTLITLHLFAASLLAPLFVLVAITGGLYMAGVEGSTKDTPLALPNGTSFNTKSPAFEADVRQFLKAQNVNVDFEYIRVRGENFVTRPTSRTHVAFEKKDGVLQAKLVEPTALKALMEIHMGHGPKIYKTYAAVAGLALLLVVLGGVFIGLLSPAYRKATLSSVVVGSALFAWFAFLA